jgi:nitrate/TMAO reductase-like tetraheme cytochrome c subunit
LRERVAHLAVDLLCSENPFVHIIGWPVHAEPLSIITLIAAAAAAVILVSHLVIAPRLDLRIKLLLFLGLGILPAISAGASTVAGMETTTHRTFCGSCHVMSAHFDDTMNPASQSLAARHSRNPFFGDRSCYVCHADYGMYGYVLTKAGGLRHVYLYYFGGYRKMSLEQAKKEIHLVKPYDNTNCRQCHSGTVHDWKKLPDHRSLDAELASNRVSCASAGCHGYAHPFTKPAAPARVSRAERAEEGRR